MSRVLLSAALAMSGSVSVLAAEADKWAPYVEVEGKLGTDRNLGELGFFLPLGQSQDSLLFANLISRIDDQDSFEGNLGLGYREIVNDAFILGGYAFFDRRRSAADNYFSQVTLGAEFMTDVWTARTNVYLANDDLKTTGGGVVSQSGSQIFVQSNVEGALSGGDVEVGRVVPLGLDEVTLTGFVGGFHFERTGFDNVSGPRGRVELSLSNLWNGVLPSGTQLRFGAEVQHDDVRDAQGFLSARLRVPLFSSGQTSNDRVLDRRMVDPIVRDIDVVSGRGLTAPVAPLLLGRTLQSVSVVNGANDLGTALVSAGSQSLVIVDGSAGPVTSGGGVTLQPGQVVVGAQNAQLVLTDPTTGQSVQWNPTPNGVRPTVQGVLINLPSDGVVSGLNLSSSLVLPSGGGASLSSTNAFNLLLTGNAFAGGSAQCVALGSGLANSANGAFSGGSGLGSQIQVAGGGNLAQLVQLNLQLAQAQALNCVP